MTIDHDHDPEQHSFEVRPATEDDFTQGREHVLAVTHPALGDGGYASTTVHGFFAEMASWYDSRLRPWAEVG